MVLALRDDLELPLAHSTTQPGPIVAAPRVVGLGWEGLFASSLCLPCSSPHDGSGCMRWPAAAITATTKCLRLGNLQRTEFVAHILEV